MDSREDTNTSQRMEMEGSTGGGEEEQDSTCAMSLGDFSMTSLGEFHGLCLV